LIVIQDALRLFSPYVFSACLLYPFLLATAGRDIPLFTCFFLLIYPLFRLRSIWPSLDSTADHVDHACKLEYRLVTAWEYRFSAKKQAKPLLREVTALLNKTDICRIFKIKPPPLLLWAIPPLLVGVFFHATLLSPSPHMKSIAEIPVPQEQIADSELEKKEQEAGIDIRKELLKTPDKIQEIVSGLQEGSLNERAAIMELSEVKERLQKNFDSENAFLDLSLKSELMVKLFNKLAKLDMAISNKIGNKKLQQLFKEISITIPIQVYDPNAPYDPRFARPGAGGSGDAHPGGSPGREESRNTAKDIHAQNEIGELIDTHQGKSEPGKIAHRRRSTGASISFFSAGRLPKSYRDVLRSYFGNR
jgi:hypothetical protein